MPTGVWLYSYFGLWAMLFIESLLLVALIRQAGALYEHWVRNDPDWGLPLGTQAPALAVPQVFGDPIPPVARPGRLRLLLFLSRGCSSCQDAMRAVPELSHWEHVDLILIVSANETMTQLYMSGFRREAGFPHVPVLADGERALIEAYNVLSVPYAVVVDPEDRVRAKGLLTTAEQARGLLRHADATTSQDGTAPHTGTQAPALETSAG